MSKSTYILFIAIFSCFTVFAQITDEKKFEVKGVVKIKGSDKPISGVEVSATSGAFVITNVFGEYKIMVVMNDELVFRSSEFETVTYRVINDEDVDVLVEGLEDEKWGNSRSSSRVNLHRSYLDSAKNHKTSDIGKSIDFIRMSLEQLNKRGNKTERAASYSLLGEIYDYHKQYDLAIENYKEALLANQLVTTQILLGNAYIKNREFKNAEKLFSELSNKKKLTTYQKIQVSEGLGDAYKGLQNVPQAISNYNQGLEVAKKKTIAPKEADLNTKIAETYAESDNVEDAEEYYDNSIEAAKRSNPRKALEAQEKASDFYNKNNLYDKEIEYRKRSLDEVKKLPAPKSKLEISGVDPISSQVINYKIANNLIVQQKYDEAIPYLEESIADAKKDDDLVVQKDATRKLSEVFEVKGDYTNALDAYRSYAAVADTLYVRKEQEISRASRLSKQITAKQNRITGLEKDKELQDSKYSLASTEQELNRKQKVIIYSLIIGMLLLGLAAFFFYRANRQQKLANNLLALKSLRSQMNPHFIFNALNSVNNYISKSDERSANRYLSDFSTLMRAVLENSEEDFIPLTKELELLELYVKLEHSRFSDKFDYTVKVDKHIDVAAFQIPPMLLQPYIENAIWHGLRYKDEKGFLNIDLKQKDQESIEITIADNGIGRKKSAKLKTQNQKKQRSKGMGNIKKRVEILNDMYKDKVDVFIQDMYDDESGTKVVLTLKRD